MNEIGWPLFSLALSCAAAAWIGLALLLRLAARGAAKFLEWLAFPE